MSDKRAQIEQAATDAIKQAGLSSVSFRTLAEEVGVKSSSVHYHFPTKADLAESVIRRYTEDFNAQLNRILREKRTLPARLNAFIDCFERVTRANEMCLCGSLAAESATLDDGARRALKTFFNVSEAWLVAAIEEAGQKLPLGLSAEELAAVLMAGLEGAGLVDRALEETTHLNAFRRMVEEIT